MNIFDTYFKSLITQTRGLVNELKAKDESYHSSINPTSIYGELPISLSQNYNLVKLFKEKFGNIEVVFVNDESFIKAFTVKYEDKQDLYITKCNSCWTRFYTCKELAQILIYTEKNATRSLVDVDELLSSLISGTDIGSNNPQITADNITYFAAVEFLLPSDDIDKLFEMKEKGFSNEKIAKKMLTPESIVDFRLSTAGRKLFNSILQT